METLVELGLTLGELDGDAKLILLRSHDGVGTLLFSRRHVLPQLSDVVIVFHAFCHQPAIDRDHRGEAEPEHENESGISASDRKSTRLNSSHPSISYAVFCL